MRLALQLHPILLHPRIYPTSASIYTRVVDTTGLSEFHIDYGPNLVLILTGSFPNTSSAIFFQGYDTGSLYPLSSSWALNVVSASQTVSASYSVTASYALNAATATALNGTNPTYKLYASASTPSSSFTSVDVLTAVTFSSSYARTDGADIRVQWADANDNPSGSYLPIAVGVMQVSGSSTIFQVYWTDTFVSNSLKKYVITYGDPLGQYMYLSQNQLLAIRKRGQMMPGTSTVVYNDNSQADFYTATQWGTIGTRIAGITGVDDATAQIPVPSPYIYNNATQVSFSVSTNGQFRYGNASFSSYGVVAPDQWGVNNQDSRQVWCDVCTNADGWALQYFNQRNLGAAGNYKLIVRYQNSGKFKLTIFDTDTSYQAGYSTNTIQGYTGTTYWGWTNGTVITASNPLSAFCVIIENLAQAVTSGSERSYP